MSGCYFCQRHLNFGNSVSHSKRRLKRVFKLNLSKIQIKGKNLAVCSRCLKKMDFYETKT